MAGRRELYDLAHPDGNDFRLLGPHPAWLREPSLSHATHGGVLECPLTIVHEISEISSHLSC
jgi:hypothetical protein